jgi:hypothetical protein
MKRLCRRIRLYERSIDHAFVGWRQRYHRLIDGDACRTHPPPAWVVVHGVDEAREGKQCRHENLMSCVLAVAWLERP